MRASLINFVFSYPPKMQFCNINVFCSFGIIWGKSLKLSADLTTSSLTFGMEEVYGRNKTVARCCSGIPLELPLALTTLGPSWWMQRIPSGTLWWLGLMPCRTSSAMSMFPGPLTSPLCGECAACLLPWPNNWKMKLKKGFEWTGKLDPLREP